MILDVGQLATNHDLPAIALLPQSPETRGAILDFVAAEYPQFSQYYASPRAGTAVYAVMRAGQMVGAVLIEHKPRAAEAPTDGALACLVTAEHLRGQRLG